MQIWALWVLLDNETGETILGLGFGNIITIVVYIVLLTVFFVSIREQVRELKEAKGKYEDAIKELRTDLTRHCVDDDVHISSQIFNLIMSRFDSVERKIESQNDSSRTGKR